jgi:predicted ArsR family transcriptional regulator
MDGRELNNIIKGAKQQTSKLYTPYAALKTLVMEQTGKKTKRYEMLVSERDMEIAELLSEELGISVASLYRHLAKLAFQEWGREQQEAEDDAENAAFDDEMAKLLEM